MIDRHINALRSFADAGLHTVALVSLVRRIGPRRIGRLAALATEGYLANESRRRSGRETPMLISPSQLTRLLGTIARRLPK
jgi:hypothetical protein